MGNEELATAGVLPVECHPNGATQERRLVEFVSQGVSGATFAVCPRVTSLHKIVRNDAVKRQTVIETATSQRHKVVGGHRRVNNVQLQLDRSVISLDVDMRRYRGSDQSRCREVHTASSRSGADHIGV